MADIKYKEQTCPACGGRGWVRDKKDTERVRCGLCGGRGKIYEAFKYIPTKHQRKTFIIKNPLKK